MTRAMKAAEKREQEEMLARHQRERVELERSQREEESKLVAAGKRKRHDLDMRQLKEDFALSDKYGHEIGPGGRSILDGTYNRRRR
jgi:hypothetical protein